MTRGGSIALVFGLVASPMAAGGGGGAMVIHPPRVQLGDAPLATPPESGTDRVTIMWETTGPAEFDVAIRAVGDEVWSPAAPVISEVLEGDRVLHQVGVVGLEWATDYEYWVRQLREGIEVDSWTEGFRTRLARGDARPFSFGAYGDSAAGAAPEPFDAVQRTLAGTAASFSLLLGDNAYESGTFADLDARFDPSISPAAAAWVASHVEYPAFGNHDVRTDGGAPTAASFAVPVPAGSQLPPPGEPPEHNYSFDYGMVHFLTFDSNSITSPGRLDALLDWVEADLAASDATWKIVFAHHPVGGFPDKGSEPDSYPHYERELVTRLEAAGVALLFAGHSHTYSWSFPLTGVTGGTFEFVDDGDGSFAAGAGVVQVIAGVGGRSLRPGTYGAPFIAAGFTLDSDPPSGYGLALISVSTFVLTVEYLSAADGQVIGAFSIVLPTPAFGARRVAV